MGQRRYDCLAAHPYKMLRRALRRPARRARRDDGEREGARRAWSTGCATPCAGTATGDVPVGVTEFGAISLPTSRMPRTGTSACRPRCSRPPRWCGFVRQGVPWAAGGALTSHRLRSTLGTTPHFTSSAWAVIQHELAPAVHSGGRVVATSATSRIPGDGGQDEATGCSSAVAVRNGAPACGSWWSTAIRSRRSGPSCGCPAARRPARASAVVDRTGPVDLQHPRAPARRPCATSGHVRLRGKTEVHFPAALGDRAAAAGSAEPPAALGYAPDAPPAVPSSGGPPPMTRVYLHIGAPKTGTTYLQEVLFRNRARLAEHGVLYPGDSTAAHYAAVLDLRELSFARLRRPRRRGGVGGGREPRPATGAARRSMISHELLAAAKAESIERALASLGEHEVHVVLTARDLGRQVPAVWQEMVKNQQTIDFETYLDAADHPRPQGPRRADLLAPAGRRRGARRTGASTCPRRRCTWSRCRRRGRRPRCCGSGCARSSASPPRGTRPTVPRDQRVARPGRGRAGAADQRGARRAGSTGPSSPRR